MRIEKYRIRGLDPFVLPGISVAPIPSFQAGTGEKTGVMANCRPYLHNVNSPLPQYAYTRLRFSATNRFVLL